MTLEDLTALRIERGHRRFIADRLSAEIGCEVSPHPMLKATFEARDPLPGVWLLAGTPDEIRAEVRRVRAEVRRGWMLVWLSSLGSLSRPA
jgi:hypothetical protein